MKIAIVGAGFTGLTAAYRFSQKGHQVTLFEKEKDAGGLSVGFKKENWQWTAENFYHHLFTDDRAAQKLIDELGLTNKLFYTRPKTSIYLKGKISQFDSPLSVLKFPHLSLPQKSRAGLVTAFLKFKPNWKKLEKTTVQKWLVKYYGKKIYQLLWEPLLKAKFGQKASQISMAWFWARIKKRSFQLGYLGGGFQILANKLAKEIKKNNGQVFLNQEIRRFSDLNRFDQAIFTTPASVFLKIIGFKAPLSYQKKLSQLKMIGFLNLIFVLKEKFLIDHTYWLNINEKNFPFVAVVEHTNFVNTKHYGGDHLLYVGGYYPSNHRFFKMKKQTILKEFFPYLKKIKPEFKESQIISYELRDNLHAQPIVPINYSRLIPKIKTPIPNVFLANMQMVYPWDRGINFAIELGEKVVDEILKKN